MDGLIDILQNEASRKYPEIQFHAVQLDPGSFRNYDKNTRGRYNTHNTDVDLPLLSQDKQLLENAEIIVGDATFLAKCLPFFKKANWVHSTYAGVDKIVSSKPELPNFILTRHVGTSFGQQMGEYVLVQILARERRLFAISSDMEQCKWPWQDHAPRTLPSLSIGILGVGNIGRKIGEMCKSMQMTVWGLTRTNRKELAWLDRNCQFAELPELLESCDYICNVLPSTPKTRGLLDGDILKYCASKKSVLINIGRGSIISEDTIVEAISEGWLGGAILDVFENEPLPTESLLWKNPSVTLTPHMAGLCDVHDTAAVFLTNLDMYLSGQPLQHVVDFSHGY